jgi:hypothetical protein
LYISSPVFHYYSGISDSITKVCEKNRHNAVKHNSAGGGNKCAIQLIDCINIIAASLMIHHTLIPAAPFAVLAA